MYSALPLNNSALVIHMLSGGPGFHICCRKEASLGTRMQEESEGRRAMLTWPCHASLQPLERRTLAWCLLPQMLGIWRLSRTPLKKKIVIHNTGPSCVELHATMTKIKPDSFVFIVLASCTWCFLKRGTRVN